MKRAEIVKVVSKARQILQSWLKSSIADIAIFQAFALNGLWREISYWPWTPVVTRRELTVGSFSSFHSYPEEDLPHRKQCVFCMGDHHRQLEYLAVLPSRW